VPDDPGPLSRSIRALVRQTQPTAPLPRTPSPALHQARLDVVGDDLRAIRAVHEAVTRAAIFRTVQAVETVVLEIRCAGESLRYSIVNRAHLEMTRQFLDQVAAYEAFRERTSPELVDALKQRALEEFTTRMNRASKETAPPPGRPVERGQR
jgi:hypothetical protein